MTLSWISILWYVLTNIPSELKALEALMALIRTIFGTSQATALHQSLSDAVKAKDNNAVVTAIHSGMTGTPPGLVS